MSLESVLLCKHIAAPNMTIFGNTVSPSIPANTAHNPRVMRIGLPTKNTCLPTSYVLVVRMHKLTFTTYWQCPCPNPHRIGIQSYELWQTVWFALERGSSHRSNTKLYSSVMQHLNLTTLIITFIVLYE